MKPQVAILGAGSMGQILAEGLLRGGWGTDDIVMVARRQESAADAEQRTRVRTLLDPAVAALGRDVIVVAVKPKDVAHLLAQVAGTLTASQIVISLAAGVPIALFERVLGELPVVRTMSNTPAAVGQGMTAYCGGTHADDAALAIAKEVLSALGETIRLSEELLDAVAAIAGSGPAYLFLLAEALVRAAVREGLPDEAARRLVDQTMRGSGLLLRQSGKSAVRLRGDVTSPGGTTEAAMQVLEEGGFRALIEDAVRAATVRSRELGEAASSAVAEAG
jgi:pyrroline-5-carboxylate reductase